MEWRKLTSLASSHEADLLVGRLRQAGIKARTTQATGRPAAWLSAYGNKVGPTDVFVPADKANAARQVLAGLNSSRQPHADRSSHRTIQLVGRGLLMVSMIGLVAAVLSAALR